MAEEGIGLLADDIPIDARWGYVIRYLSDVSNSQQKIMEVVSKLDDNVAEIKNDIVNYKKELPDCSECGVKELKIAFYGDKEAQKKGMIQRVGNLEIKSGFWGIIGGSVMLLGYVIVDWVKNIAK